MREEGSPRALLSLKLAANNRSNLVSSSVKRTPHPHPHPRVQPPAPVQSAPGAQGQDSKDQLSCSGFVLLMFFPACHWSFCTFSTSGANLLPLVPAENFAFVSTLWTPAEDPSLTAAGTFSLSGPFSNGLCLVGGPDFIPCFSGIIKNSQIS